MVKIACAQLDVVFNDPLANAFRAAQTLRDCKAKGVDLVVFPECFLTGYQDTEAVTRQHAFAVDSPAMMQVLNATAQLPVTVIVGFNEARGEQLFNSAMILQQGHLLGVYSKCSAYQKFHTQGRAFPVFQREVRRGPLQGKTVTFGVVICSDGGYIEPARILATQGARIIFSPHYNSIGARGLIGHFMKVRADHTARAVENGVYFLRGNSVTIGPETGLVNSNGVGYGDSYLVDPQGEIVARSRRHVEDFFFADIDPLSADMVDGRSLYSWREYGQYLVNVIPKS